MKPWITHRLRVRCMVDQYYHQGRQELRRYTLFLDIPLWYTVLDSEEVPQYVFLSDACFGDTSGWVSKFAPFPPDGWKEYC